jgi:hypothetical protein
VKKSKSIIIPVILAGVIFTIFFCLFRFERKVELFSNINPVKVKLKKIRTLKIGQFFKVNEGIEAPGFNHISIALIKPRGKAITCNFTIKTGKNGEILANKTIILKKKDPPYHIKEISFPAQSLKHRDSYYFEISAANFFYTFVKGPGENTSNQSFRTFIADQPMEKSLVFGVYFRETSSILSYLLGSAAGRISMIGVSLVILSLLSLVFSVYYLLKIIKAAFNPATSSPGNVVARGNYIIILSIAVFVCLFIIITFVIGNNTFSKLAASQDDAFISYKYAKNISAGIGFRFNPDEKILGTTTPLYTLLLSFFGLFTDNLNLVSLLLGLISIVLSAVILNLVLSKYLSPGIGLAGAIVFLLFPMFYRIIGMETNFLIFLIIAGLYLFSEKKYGLSFFLIGLATLTRIESVLLVPLFIIHLVLKKEYRRLFKVAGIYLLTILPWFIFSYLYFGNILPNTFYIKTAVGSTGETIFNKIYFFTRTIIELKFLKSVFFKGFFNFVPNMIQYYPAWMLLFLVGLLFSLKYLFKLSFLRLYFSWALLYVFSFAVLNVPLFTWYYVLAFPVIPIFLVVGLYSIWNLISKRFNSKPLMVYLPVIVLFGLAVFEMNGIFNLFCSKWYSRHIPHLERFETYLDVSNYIKKNISKEKSIATEEIGILGYSIENKIWDFHCLVHDVKQYPHYLPSEKKHRLPYLLTLMDPDYLLLNSFRLKSHEVFQNYREIKVFKVNEFKGNPGFYYSLLEKKHDQLVVLGDVQVNEKLSGQVKLKGWAFADVPIESVEVLVNEQVLSRTNTFYASPPEFIELFKHNQFAGQSVFYLQVDTTQMANGTYDLVFRAAAGPNTGVFRKIKVTINNPVEDSDIDEDEIIDVNLYNQLNREWNKFRWYSIPSIAKKMGTHRKTVVYWRDFGLKINGANIRLKMIKRPFQWYSKGKWLIEFFLKTNVDVDMGGLRFAALTTGIIINDCMIACAHASMHPCIHAPGIQCNVGNNSPGTISIVQYLYSPASFSLHFYL